ncbi:hypothetical protein A1O3_08331 [Capronia epimyces CBS 606.96]|uniref:Uncharacterized protein n=1 Tax=Capronia epimyces CBS 606.96 TaxID=1182542 RepID=W9XRT6_9EURO|nr:uncharacterized protein A1O3_08331 [Capronia epimyces CBS 606.96]EXJ80045.1 hypothetical protein A1O3_08331 [Capronia epimyces CBS 606.96]
MVEAARRSARQHKVNPIYANDGWDKDTLRVLRASSESSGSSPDEKAPVSDHGNEQSSEAADDISLDSAPPSQSSDIQSLSEDDDDISLVSKNNTTGVKNSREKPHLRVSSSTAASAHSRGIAPGQSRGSKRAAYEKTFGPGVEDLSDVLRARDSWLKGRDVTIPSRRSISNAIAHSRTSRSSCAPTGNEAHTPLSPISTNDTPLAEIIHNNQILTEIDDQELHEKYLPRRATSHSIVLGARGKQSRFNLAQLSSLDFGQAWSVDTKSYMAAEQAIRESVPNRRHHEGWLLDVGEKVQCMAWAPLNGHLQYLAIVTRCTPGQRRSVPGDGSDRPAFHPSPSYSSSIQIWAFQTEPTETNHVRTLSFKVPPMLALVVATDWGDIRRIEWCPSIATEIITHPTYRPDVVTGLLGVISTDGCARVLALRLPENLNSHSPIALKAEQAGVTISPHADMVFTCLAFIDPKNLTVGASDGSIQLFDLARQSNGGQSPESYFKQQVHNTYITSLCSASPSPCSTFIASTSASGELVLTDLRSPDQDKISIPRACFPHRDLLFSPFTRSFITGLDRAGNTHVETHSATFVVCHHLRQFPTGLRIAKLPDYTGAVTALANSPWHPCILIGNARGQVLSTNYLRKVLPYRRGDPRKAADAYLQKICEYDWRPLSADELGDPSHLLGAPEEVDLYHGQGVRPGLSRFHEGFKPERVEVGSVPLTRKTLQQKDIGVAEPIFEEEQAVTSIDWCPNAACAGLAAIGWGSGIVRVQDLAHDLV